DTARYHNICLPGFYEGSCHRYCGHSRGAEPIDRNAGNGIGEACEEPGHAGYISVVFTGTVGVAEDHLVDTPRVNAGIGDHCFDGQCCEIVGPNAGQGTAITADGGPQSGDEVSAVVSHG